MKQGVEDNMKITAVLAAAAMLAATTAPAVAAPRAAGAANPAASLSVAKSVRASTPTAKSNKLIAENPAVSVLIAAAAIGGLVVLSSTLGDDAPDSN